MKSITLFITVYLLSAVAISHTAEPQFCSGYLNSCWFTSSSDFGSVFGALLLFMVAMMSLGWLGKMIRTGGNG